MRVGLDFRPALLRGHGIGRYTNELARAFYSNSDLPNPVLFGVKWAKDKEPDGAWFHRNNDVRLIKRRWPARSLGILSKLGWGADRLCGGLDLFHYTDVVYPKIRRARRVITLHDSAFALEKPYHDERFRRTVLERVRTQLKSADLILTPTQFTADEAIRLNMVDSSDKLRTVLLGGDHASRGRTPLDISEPDHPHRRPYFTAVGTLEPRKNYPRLLRAFDRLVERGFEGDLHVIGARGWMMEPIDQAKVSLKNPKRVLWRDSLSDDEMWRLVEGGIALLYPSLYEGFGLPVAEAFHLGVPVMTSSIGALAEVSSGAAHAIDPEDEDAIFLGMERLAEDEPYRRELVQRGKVRAQALTWKRTAKTTWEAYKSLLC